MTIGNKEYMFAFRDYRHALPENKWIFGFEIRKCPRQMFGVLRPSIGFTCFKILDVGEPGLLNGRPFKMKGFRLKEYVCPLLISLEVQWNGKDLISTISRR